MSHFSARWRLLSDVLVAPFIAAFLLFPAKSLLGGAKGIPGAGRVFEPPSNAQISR
jgi:hypothetical protein